MMMADSFMAFPGEDRYVQAQQLGPLVTKQGPSPYVLSLRYFPKALRKGGVKRAVKFDVEYRGTTISEVQVQAVQRLVADAERL